MNKRQIVGHSTILIVLILVYNCYPVLCFSATKLNILMIIIDDLRHLSDKDVNLPNIKNMAASGVNFKNAIAQQALCAPSRNSMLTGRRPDSLHLYDFYSYWRHAAGNFTTIPQYFKDNGYNTYSVGKVFHPGISSNFTDDYPYSWTHKPYHPPSERFMNAAVCKDYTTLKLQSNLVCPVEVNTQPGRTLPDLESLEKALGIVKNNSSRPFLLAVGFHKPHIPLRFPKHYLDKVPINNVEPPTHPNMPRNLPLVSWHPWTDVRRRDDIRRLNISFPFGTMPNKWTLKIRQGYFAAALYIDHLVGELMRHVDTKNTIVVLTSDHGWSLGENGLWAKYSNFDVSLRVPLIFLAPNIKTKNIHTPVELLDIFPTLVDLTGLHYAPKCKSKFDKSLLCFEGKSLVPLMKEATHGNYVAISQYPRPSVYPQKNSDKPRLKNIKIMGYSLRTNRFRYTEWVSFNNTSFTIDWNNVYGLELYDHVVDPEESNNLYLVHQYKYVRQYLSIMLRLRVDQRHELLNK